MSLLQITCTSEALRANRMRRGGPGKNLKPSQNRRHGPIMPPPQSDPPEGRRRATSETRGISCNGSTVSRTIRGAIAGNHRSFPTLQASSSSHSPASFGHPARVNPAPVRLKLEPQKWLRNGKAKI
jgi:hypothetical protein